MPAGLLFWMLMILCVLFGCWWSFGGQGPLNYPAFGMNLITWVLLALLGWKTFGKIVQ
jgi:hypothetical protein